MSFSGYTGQGTCPPSQGPDNVVTTYGTYTTAGSYVTFIAPGTQHEVVRLGVSGYDGVVGHEGIGGYVGKSMEVQQPQRDRGVKGVVIHQGTGLDGQPPKKNWKFDPEKPRLVDLACGQRKQEGHIGVDIVGGPGVDIVHDLSVSPWPFDSDSVEGVYISHYIEHTTCLMQFMNELYRILKPKGQCMIVAPYYTSMRCWQDPTHTRAISEATMLYYNAQWRKDNLLDHYPITADFDFTYGYSFYPEWQTRHEEARLFAVKHYNNVVSDIQFCLTKRES